VDRLRNYVGGAARACSTLELAAIRGAKAERLLVAIWRILEAHSLTSPVISVNSANGLFDISLTFESAKDCALVESSLPSKARFGLGPNR
jgi:hypothetical protein